MFPIALATYQTKPRLAEISAEPITKKNRAKFEECPHITPPIQHRDIVALICNTKHGQVEAQFGDHIIFGDGEAYPIKPDELAARYELVHAG